MFVVNFTNTANQDIKVTGAAGSVNSTVKTIVFKDNVTEQLEDDDDDASSKCYAECDDISYNIHVDNHKPQDNNTAQ